MIDPTLRLETREDLPWVEFGQKLAAAAIRRKKDSKVVQATFIKDCRDVQRRLRAVKDEAKKDAEKEIREQRGKEKDGKDGKEGSGKEGKEGAGAGKLEGKELQAFLKERIDGAVERAKKERTDLMDPEKVGRMGGKCRARDEDGRDVCYEKKIGCSIRRRYGSISFAKRIAFCFSTTRISPRSSA